MFYNQRQIQRAIALEPSTLYFITQIKVHMFLKIPTNNYVCQRLGIEVVFYLPEKVMYIFSII